MDLSKMFELGGLNLWLVVAGNGMNLILAGGALIAVTLLGGQSAWAPLLLLIGPFLGTALVAFTCGRMERERYMSYAAYTLPGNLLVTVPSILFSPLLGLMTVVVSVLGAFNGARLADMSVAKHSRQ